MFKYALLLQNNLLSLSFESLVSYLDGPKSVKEFFDHFL